jgi:hypothetical protein
MGFLVFHSGVVMCVMTPCRLAGAYGLHFQVKIGNFFQWNLRNIRGALQAERLRVRFPMGSLGFFINPSDRTMAVGSTHPVTEISTGADNLTTFVCRLSRNQGD